MLKNLRGISLTVAVLYSALQGATADAREVRDPWVSLPADARLITDPGALSALIADHTVRGIYLPDGTQWREYSAADGRTIWEFDGCLHPGTWRVSGSAVCYVYPTWDEGQPQCFMVYQSKQLTHEAAHAFRLAGPRNRRPVAHQQRSRAGEGQSRSPAVGGSAQLRRSGRLSDGVWS